MQAGLLLHRIVRRRFAGGKVRHSRQRPRYRICRTHAIPEAEPSNFEQMVFAIRSLQMSMIQTGNYLLIATAAVIAVERAVNAFDLSNRFVLPPISGFDSN